MLVDRYAQVGRLDEQVAIVGRPDAPSISADLHQCPGVAKPAAACFECAEGAVATYHSAADAFSLDAFRRDTDKRIFGKPDPQYLRAGFLKNFAAGDLDTLQVAGEFERDRGLDLSQDLVPRIESHLAPRDCQERLRAECEGTAGPASCPADFPKFWNCLLGEALLCDGDDWRLLETASMTLNAEHRPLSVDVLNGEVVMTGPRVAIALHPDAAIETARRLTAAADLAIEQARATTQPINLGASGDSC